jgi:hypothetical protein
MVTSKNITLIDQVHPALWITALDRVLSLLCVDEKSAKVTYIKLFNCEVQI